MIKSFFIHNSSLSSGWVTEIYLIILTNIYQKRPHTLKVPSVCFQRFLRKARGCLKFCTFLSIAFLATAREVNVFAGVCHSVHNCHNAYSFTDYPCYGTVGTHPTGMLSCVLLIFYLPRNRWTQRVDTKISQLKASPAQKRVFIRGLTLVAICNDILPWQSNLLWHYFETDSEFIRKVSTLILSVHYKLLNKNVLKFFYINVLVQFTSGNVLRFSGHFLQISPAHIHNISS